MEHLSVFILLAGAVPSCYALLGEPQRYPNESFLRPGIPSTHGSPHGLFERATSNFNCPEGYFACLDGTTKCCIVGSTCCRSNQYCVLPPGSCCGLGTCPGGTKCCGGINCISVDSDCCAGGHYCKPGTYCRIWQDRNVCCPASGCDVVTTTTRSLSLSGTYVPTISPTLRSKPNESPNAPLAVGGLAIGVAGALGIICVLLFSRLPKGLLDRKESHTASPPSPPSQLSNSLHESKGGSWKVTLYLGSAASLVVLLFNTGFAAWAVKQNTEPDGSGVLFEGECRRARKINTGLHLIINILATLVLGASSYGMQCLGAPTRKVLDRVHREGDCLDIGILSLRNLSRIPRKKLVLWSGLALSSLPLHLIYNSTIFLTTGAYEAPWLIGNRTFAEVSDASLRSEDKSFASAYRSMPSLISLREQESNGGLRRMDKLECIDSFAVNLQSKYGLLLLVCHGYQASKGVFDLLDSGTLSIKESGPWGLMCSSDNVTYSCTADNLRANAETLTVYDWGTQTSYRVDYCLAMKVQEQCKVKYSLPLLVVVIIFNIIKAGILWGITMTSNSVPLLTTGDAIAGFLENPDPFSRPRSQWKYSKTRQRWYKAVSVKRWVGSCLLLIGSIIAGIALLHWGVTSDGNDGLSDAWTQGIGAADTRYLIQGEHRPTTVPGNTMMANIPQVVFSFIYFAINGALTAMVQANEWSQYAVNRKGLRVSTTAKGKQRSTYFLSLPYRYSIPQLIFSMVLHWLISQSLFLVYVEVYSPTLAPVPGHGFITCGYSPVAIICTLAVGSFMGIVLISLAVGFRFESGMPIAGSSSLAIAAACHPYPSQEDSGEPYPMSGTERNALQWGVVSTPYNGAAHCSFSGEEVTTPADQSMYL